MVGIYVYMSYSIYSLQLLMNRNKTMRSMSSIWPAMVTALVGSKDYEFGEMEEQNKGELVAR